MLRLRRRHNAGQSRLTSAAAPDVADLSYALADVLRCPLQLRSTDDVLNLEEGVGSVGPPEIGAAIGVISIQCGCFPRVVLPVVQTKWD